MQTKYRGRRTIRSPRTAGRGLKSETLIILNAAIAVAPHGGAWIEIFRDEQYYNRDGGRPSRRGVD